MRKLLYCILFFLSLNTLGMNQFDAQKHKKPMREVAIIASDDGYFPNKISAFVGEKIRLLVTSSSDKKQCLILEKHEVFLPAEKGKIADKLIVLDSPGRYKIYCPATDFVGHLTVLEKPGKKAKTQIIERTIASEPEQRVPHYWIPRDYDN